MVTTPQHQTQDSLHNRQAHSHQLHNRQLYNRIAALMAHTTRYAFKSQARLAADAGVSKSAVSRLLRGQSSPSFALLCRIAGALGRQFGTALDLRDLVSFDGRYPTPSVCQLAGCHGCLPAEAYDEEGNLKAAFIGVKPQQWSLSSSVNAPAPQQPKAQPLKAQQPEKGLQ